MAVEVINRYNHETKKWERVPKTSTHTPGVPAIGTVPTPLTKANSSEGADESFNAPRYVGGSVRSVNVLNMLRFDPIEELVNQYRRLEAEIHWHEQLRNGEIVPLDPNGKPRHYSATAHMAVYERLQSIGSDLLRYGYGRVPESVDLNVNRPTKLVINLTKQGETFEINNESNSE